MVPASPAACAHGGPSARSLGLPLEAEAHLSHHRGCTTAHSLAPMHQQTAMDCDDGKGPASPSPTLAAVPATLETPSSGCRPPLPGSFVDDEAALLHGSSSPRSSQEDVAAGGPEDQKQQAGAPEQQACDPCLGRAMLQGWKVRAWGYFRLSSLQYCLVHAHGDYSSASLPGAPRMHGVVQAHAHKARRDRVRAVHGHGGTNAHACVSGSAPCALLPCQPRYLAPVSASTAPSPI
jgi:hypothetical protein